MQATTATRGIGALLRRDPAAPWRHLDLPLIGAALAVTGLGCLMIYSATRTSMADAGLDPYTYLKRQMVFAALGLVVAGAVVAVDYRNFRDLAPAAYLVSLGLLALVLTPLGTEVNFAKSWFSIGTFQLQPAELAKLGLILLLAASCSTDRGQLSRPRLVAAVFMTGLVVGLILLQPDMGSGLVVVAILIGVVVVAGARPRHLAVLAAVAVVGVLAMFRFDWVDEYQRDRLTDFARSDNEVRASSGFQAEQAETAIGAGGVFGAGLYEGTQTKLGFVPEQQTDFIFTVVGEELGFVGSATLLSLYGVILWRIWRTAQLSKDLFGTLVCAGVFALLLFQVFENMGMSMGIMPITGIPLPLLSYGGSSMLTTCVALGLVLNVHMRRFS
ncbi:MAG TPA: rod shape-determining protein RodA [Acidimicrobiales bacterium]|jgi:rod shape determining protein RodA|nr:rod shape-determining protein RodA [Acidimicrobiales bacterium]